MIGPFNPYLYSPGITPEFMQADFMHTSVGTIRIFHQRELIAEHRLSSSRGEMVIERSHYAKPAVALLMPILHTPAPMVELAPGPGVRLHFVAPEFEFRSLAIYNAFCEEVAHVASV